jgi:hypothetical protein
MKYQRSRALAGGNQSQMGMAGVGHLRIVML